MPLTLKDIDTLYYSTPLCVVFPDGTDAMIQDNDYTIEDCARFISQGAKIFCD